MIVLLFFGFVLFTKVENERAVAGIPRREEDLGFSLKATICDLFDQSLGDIHIMFLSSLMENTLFRAFL